MLVLRHAGSVVAQSTLAPRLSQGDLLIFVAVRAAPRTPRPTEVPTWRSAGGPGKADACAADKRIAFGTRQVAVK